MLDKKEGYSKVVINNITYKHCNDCKFNQRRLIRSGRDPQYEIMCTSELVDKMYYTYKFLKEKYAGYTLTPGWCPYTESIEREEKINTLIDEKGQETHTEDGEK